ncbi:hypothetical protein CI238_09008 [Colletotrichum incanum]|uniref:Uncharacterized protein n=1 Tax=Colletotrichum incanum TaxID=1573173 RepID=A0A166MMJ5_COLIC|nr:hypothetical protein CI238_09008 [Colletotrichum incanum]OHW89884.1 hypothetical protein CSPAE12_11527 [Colletotrichum incanum]
MASKDTNKNKDHESVRRTLWPTVDPMTHISEKNSQQKNLADDILQQQQIKALSSVEDERHDALFAGAKKVIREMKPAGGVQNQDSINSGLTDEERRQAFLADLYEGPYVNIGRPILVPVSRLRRTNLHGANTRIVGGSSDDEPLPSGFRNESSGVLGGPATSDSSLASSTLIHLHPLSIGEALRSNKVVCLDKEVNSGIHIDPKKPSPGGVNPVIIDSIPKDLLALGMKDKTIDSAHTNSVMEIDKNEAKLTLSTPETTPPSFQWENRPYGATPDRPRTAKTAPAAMSVYNGMEADESPSLRHQMERLRVNSADAFNSCPTTSSGSMSRPASHPQGPRAYYFGLPVPRTPTKGKRARCEFEKTTTLSGRDVAREREILARFAAATKDEDEDEEEPEEG